MDTRRRAALTALFALVGATFGVAGVGQAYLRRWRRALAWFGVVLGVTAALVVAFADPTTVTARELPSEVVFPVVALLLLNVVDAYALARQDDPAGGDAPGCPYCGKELDPTMDFCWYCAGRIEWTTDPVEAPANDERV